MQSKLLILISGFLFILPTQTSFAGSLHADAGVTSDYVWRGLTQTNGKPAVQGGLEFVTNGAWYFGTWVSNTSYGENGANSPEVDYYIGLTGKGKTLAYDLGMINYTYPESSGDGFSELYFSLILEKFNFKYSNSSDAGTYLEGNVTYDLPIKKETTLTLHVGNYSRNNASSYIDANVTIRVSEFSLTISKATVSTAQDKDIKTFVGWNRSF